MECGLLNICVDLALLRERKTPTSLVSWDASYPLSIIFKKVKIIKGEYCMFLEYNLVGRDAPK
jgi:hypothetical protein